MHPDDERLLATVPADQRTAEDIPDAAQRRTRADAVRAIHELLGDLLLPDGLRVSPLGAAWSRDIDVHLRAAPDRSRLLAAGWLPLDGLLRRTGRATSGRWAILDGDRIVAPLDIHLGPPPLPLAGVVARVEDRGSVRVREVLELRTLQRAGVDLGGAPAVLAAAAERERQLGGDELTGWRASPDAPAADLRPRRRLGALRPAARRVRRATRPRVVVALSGVDGSGKSTLAARLAAALHEAGVPSSRVWIRPGMGTVELLAVFGKRLLGRGGDEAGLHAVARGDAVVPTSRRGFPGWAWTTAVVATYLLDVWRAHVRSEGVVVYDRHELDALVTLEFAYRCGALHRWAVRSLLPHADHRFYLDADAELAIGRKRDDVFGPATIRRQLELYHELLEHGGATRLDARRPVDALVRQVLGELTREG